MAEWPAATAKGSIYCRPPRSPRTPLPPIALYPARAVPCCCSRAHAVTAGHSAISHKLLLRATHADGWSNVLGLIFDQEADFCVIFQLLRHSALDLADGVFQCSFP